MAGGGAVRVATDLMGREGGVGHPCPETGHAGEEWPFRGPSQCLQSGGKPSCPGQC